MTENALVTTAEPRKRWVGALPMLLPGTAFQRATWILVNTRWRGFAGVCERPASNPVRIDIGNFPRQGARS